jgi:hypothetical protein
MNEHGNNLFNMYIIPLSLITFILNELCYILFIILTMCSFFVSRLKKKLTSAEFIL